MSISKDVLEQLNLIKNNPAKYFEQNGFKLYWYQKVQITMIAKFKNIKEKLYWILK